MVASVLANARDPQSSFLCYCIYDYLIMFQLFRSLLVYPDCTIAPNLKKQKRDLLCRIKTRFFVAAANICCQATYDRSKTSILAFQVGSDTNAKK